MQNHGKDYEPFPLQVPTEENIQGTLELLSPFEDCQHTTKQKIATEYCVLVHKRTREYLLCEAQVRAGKGSY